jgi:protease-4
MLTFLVRLFAFVGAAIVISGLVAGFLLWRHAPSLPATIVLTADLNRPLSEVSTDGPLSQALLGHELSLMDLVAVMDRARVDPKVKGLVVRLGGSEPGFAQAQELRAAIERFRQSGRFTVAFAESFGESGSGNHAYYLASGFDEIWLQPQGILGVTGFSAEVPFARKALDQLSITPEIQQREEYKSLGETFTHTEFTPAHKEMMEGLLRDLSDQMINGVARSRRLTPAAVQAAIDRAPLLGKEAVTAHMIDRIGYRDEMESEAVRRAGATADTLDVADYLDVVGRTHTQGAKVALIRASGFIGGGRSHDEPGLGELSTSADTVVDAFAAAVEDSKVVAVLFRIDSGGGSVSAGETIRRAVVRTRQAGKPVIVSMGDTAASAAYAISMNANRIVASPATLTGSIGVVGGKMAVGALSERLGVNWGFIDANRNAGMWSPLRPFTPEQRGRMTAIIDDAYNTFLAQVAEARSLSTAAVRSVAKGRVWTGAQALERGLVDELGDMETALTRAREAANLSPNADIALVEFPPPRSALEKVLALVSGQRMGVAGGMAALAAARPLLDRLAPLLNAATGTSLAVMPPTGLTPARR